jgi:endonuclease/exonuclease/phosphatase family metal-dependent hydrolase
MKKTLLSFLVVIGFTHAYAQTQPSPQPLPYQQTFDALPSASTTYPDGWQGWTLTGSPSAAFNTATPSADKALATGTASSTTNGIYNYNGKLGFLNSGSVDNSLVLAINTSGQVNISLQYDVMTLRNPYDGSSNTRINEVILQYRIGNTGSFTNMTGTEYQNTTTTQTTSGVTTPLDPATKTLVLPVDCNNQSLVQLRWVNRQVSGAGSRPSFAVDNIIAGSSGADTTPPAIAALLPANGATDVAPTTLPVITFTENIQAGNGQLILHNVTTGTQQAFPVSSLTINNAALTLTAVLHPLQTYYITLDSAAILDLSGNVFAGITDSTTWRFSTGTQQLIFDFNNCTSGTGTLSGFSQYSLSGAQVWDCTTFGQNSTNGVQINGYSGGPVENEDWLISPAFDLTGFDYPLLGFASRTAFAGPTLQLLVSTNYSGTGNPHNATWTAINGRFPQLLSDVWKTSDSINLAAFKQASVYVAFVYSASPTLGAARWTIDDIHIGNSATAPLPTIDKSPASIDFDYIPAGQQSAPQSFTFQGNDFTGNLTITASAGFLLAKDSSGSYSPSLTYTAAQADSLQTTWVKFLPTTANQAYSGSISFSGISTPDITLSGTSLRSLKVVNWNIEWFGSPAQNPANDSLQQANVTTILKKLDADIFALAEVVDTARFRTVVSQLNGYSYILSDFGSYADSIADPDYISAQKLAFVYKTSIVSSIRSYGILRKGGSSNAYYNWSSGRFPFLMEAKAKLNGDSARINFIVIHAKANTGTAAEKITSWQRRKDGNLELKDSLDAQYPSSNFVILGDFNDALDKTITTEKAPDTTTSYIDFMNDTIHYKPLTLPLALAGQQSTTSFNTVIDNVLASDELAISYVPGSARVRKEVEKLVSSYSSTTTDHYPVQTSYNLHTLANPLPVNNFTAVEDSGNVKISWQTPYEINAAYFVVERSRNMRNFDATDTVMAHGTVNLPSNYLTYDTRPWLGLSFYRLRIVGKDGTVTYSDTQRVVVTLRDIWKKLFWCIFGHQLQIWLDMEKYGPAQLQLIDIQGHIRYQSQITVNKGRNFRTLDINNLPTGVYFLRVQSLEGSQVSKILVNR